MILQAAIAASRPVQCVTVRVQDVATADELFKRALAVDCTDSSVSGSYVEFFQKHLEADYRRGRFSVYSLCFALVFYAYLTRAAESATCSRKPSISSRHVPHSCDRSPHIAIMVRAVVCCVSSKMLFSWLNHAPLQCWRTRRKLGHTAHAPTRCSSRSFIRPGLDLAIWILQVKGIHLII